MKRTGWTILVLVALLYVGPLLAQENTGPKIEARETQYDLGNVVAGSQAEHVFEVRNAGNEPLIIQRLVPS